MHGDFKFKIEQNAFQPTITTTLFMLPLPTLIKATEAVDAEQLIAKSNSYVEYQLIHMKKLYIVINNVYRPPDCPTEKFSSPLNELRTKLLEIGNPMPTSYLQET